MTVLYHRNSDWAIEKTVIMHYTFLRGAFMSKKLTVPEIIEYCKNDLGITFNLMDEQKAKTFLENRDVFLMSHLGTPTKWDICFLVMSHSVRVPKWDISVCHFFKNLVLTGTNFCFIIVCVKEF